MTRLSRPNIGERVLALGLACFALTPSLHAQPKEPGDLWEITSTMSIPGMPVGMAMPQQPPQRVCSARNADKPPVADSDRCEMTDVKKTASAFSWKMACKGNPPSTGSGEIVYQGRDAYSGTIQMTVDNQAMTMKLTGKRVGDCDAGETRRKQQAQVAAVQQQHADLANKAMAEQCRSAVETLMPAHLRPEFNCGASYKTELCNKATSLEGFKVVAARQPASVAGIPSGDLNEVGAFCGFAPADLRLKLCKRSEEQETLEFLGASCLGYSRKSGASLAAGGAADSFGAAIVARECAGRTFSSPPAVKYREFCSAAARQRLMQPVASDGATPTAQNNPPQKDDAASRGKKLLKDIFNR